jgi:dTDP-4-amino-4,6-dideoxygalactose transaminase
VVGRFFPNGGGVVNGAMRVPFVRPPAPDLDRVTEILRDSWDSGALTNGPLVAELERRTAELLQVPHVVAVSSCTTGLMLAVRALGVHGEVLMPSFTFSASAHAVAWNGATPRFAECDPLSFQLDLDDAARRSSGVSAILATHIFGAPSSPKEVEELGRRNGVPVIFDAAHAFGALHAGVPVGSFGDAEVFSLTPTKPLVAGEGGLVATKRADVADAIRIGRDYANPGDYNTRFVGLNGRMSEMHAAVALASLEQFTANQARRFEIVERYCKQFADVPGIHVQSVPASDRSSWKDFTVAIDGANFGRDRDGVRAALRDRGVDTRCYFDPPVHRHDAYRQTPASLPTTERVAGRILSLPVYPGLTDGDVDYVVETLKAIHREALAHSTRSLPESANSASGGGTSA